MVHIKHIDVGGNTYLKVGYLIEINNVKTGSNIALRKVKVKPYEFDKMYVDKDLIQDKLYQVK